MMSYSKSGDLLRFSPGAAKAMKEYFGIGRHDREDNRVEQGGWIVGFYESRYPRPVRAIVTDFIPAPGCRGTPAYLHWPEEENIRLQREFFRIRDEEVPEELRADFKRLGWVHSHPNGLGVFVSGTDLENILDHFNSPDQFSVILNPHTQVWKVFLGPEAKETAGLMLAGPEEAERPRTGAKKAEEKTAERLRYEKRIKRQRARRRRKRARRRR